METRNSEATQLSEQIDKQAETTEKIKMMCQQVAQMQDMVTKMLVEKRLASKIRCFQCRQTGHLQAQCRAKLNWMPRANFTQMPRANPNWRPRPIICNMCGGFGHVERLCRRTVPVAEPVVLSANSVRVSQEQSELEKLRAENAELKARIAELLLPQKDKKRRPRCAVCRSRAHRKDVCPKRDGHKEATCPQKKDSQVIHSKDSVKNQQQRRKRQYCPAGEVPSKGPLPAARAGPNVKSEVLIRKPRRGGDSLKYPASCVLKPRMGGANLRLNTRECVSERNFIPLQVEEFPQIKLVSASNEMKWSPKEYVVTHTPTMAGGQYILMEKNEYGPKIHAVESDLRPSELMGSHTPGSMCPEDDVVIMSTKRPGWYELLPPREPTIRWADGFRM